MKFYRVSHATDTQCSGVFSGPYGSHRCERDECEVNWEMGSAHSGVGTHPSPWTDEFPSSDWRTEWTGWYCGFDSIEALNSWFSEWFEELAACGFVCREYDVPSDSVIVGGRQSLVREDVLVMADVLDRGALVRSLTPNGVMV